MENEKEALKKQVGALCKQIRNTVGFTRDDIEKFSGFKNRTIESFERGDSTNYLILAFYIQLSWEVDNFLFDHTGAQGGFYKTLKRLITDVHNDTLREVFKNW
ncbi:hypothetical protein [Herbiconiux daphne]|uniref:XRE family transcriptional regulator n=1 Tax=Herbiconiux daphne TaxID=2970914 RepID=A0ABT2H9A8_9MICO|nr:hypothetical protein [Herbiconiux daphne]MCS5736546.1 hypothetical protein [Herbiconiux daphne]